MAAQSLEYFRRFGPHGRRLTFLYRDLVAAFARYSGTEKLALPMTEVTLV
jgi:hypothetical protein